MYVNESIERLHESYVEGYLALQRIRPIKGKKIEDWYTFEEALKAFSVSSRCLKLCLGRP
jgi:hypothetical protein